MPSAVRAFERFKRPACFLILGVVSAAVVAVAVRTLLPGRWLYHGLYPLLGPDGAVRVATTGTYTLALAGALAVSALLAHQVADGPIRTTVFGKAVVAQLLLVGLVPVAVLLDPLLVVAVVGLFNVCLLAVLVVVWYRSDVPPAPMATVTGGMIVVVLLVFFAVLVPLGWNPHTVVATEVPNTEAGTGGVRSDAISAALAAPATRCDGTRSASRTCYLPRTRPVTRFLARHGVRCPYETGVSPSSVIVVHDGSHYRVTCKTGED